MLFSSLLSFMMYFKDFLMPFTLSHAVLAPPLAKLSRYTLPTGALAIGCMVPDLIRLFINDHSGFTHLWRSVLYIDLWIGLAFCVLWYGLYRPVVYRFLGIQHSLNLNSFSTLLKFSAGTVIAIIVGTATHIIWDGLTHVDFRTFAFREFLSQPVTLFNVTYPMHRVLQIGTSFVALPFLLWMCVHYYKTYRQYRPVQSRVKYYARWLIILSVCTGSFSVWDYAQYFSSELWRSDLYFFTGKSINEFTQAALLVFSFGSALFLFLDKNGYLD